MKRAGIIVSGSKKSDINIESSEEKKKTNQIAAYSLQDLKKMLKEAINDENYEKASKLRDEINKRKK